MSRERDEALAREFWREWWYGDIAMFTSDDVAVLADFVRRVRADERGAVAGGTSRELCAEPIGETEHGDKVFFYKPQPVAPEQTSTETKEGNG